MQIIDLLKRANTHYDDGYLENYFDPKTGEFVQGKGDLLSEFIVAELQETFDPMAPDQTQIDAAIEAMETAKSDIESVIQGLRGEWSCRYCENLVALNNPREKYVGGCKFGLRPETCGKFELAKCYEGHDPRQPKKTRSGGDQLPESIATDGSIAV
jgi:hypothetical protein